MGRYDYVVFGATGFTGEFVVEELALTCGNKTFAVAARNKDKLKKMLSSVSERICKDLTNIPMIIADVGDEASLVAMAKQANVVLNVVGPYRFYGEVVVKACVENGTSHVDISGEPIYLEATQLNYNETAKQNSCYVVGACGFDSIPIETGLQVLKKEMPGDTNAVESVVEFKSGSKGSKINFGTFHSMIYGIAYRKELGSIRKALFKQRLPKPDFGLPKRKPLFYHNELEAWCLPFMGSDKSVVYRTQMYDYENRNSRPVGLNCFFKSGSLLASICMVMWGIMFFAMANFKKGREFLEKYPEIFTFGAFSKEGPSREQLKETSFSYWLFGNGWKDTMADPAEKHSTRPDTDVVVRVDGPDPGYYGTSACMVACARTILEERHNLPPTGGVFAPGAMFEKTGLISRLEERGLKFNIVSKASPIN